MLFGIQVAELPGVWPFVCDDLEAASKTSRGKWDLADIRAQLESGECQLWVWQTDTAHACIVTQIRNYAKNRCCWIRVATGENYKEWADIAIERLEAWARANGCDAMELVARPGWQRVLKGYDMTHVYLEKSL